MALWLNRPLNWVRRHLGFGYWSFSASLKCRVKKAVAFIGAVEEAVAAEARRREAHGMICGHIRHAADRTFDGVHYLNCGDWVESCTAVLESRAGEMHVVCWHDCRPDGVAHNGFPVSLQVVRQPPDTAAAPSPPPSPSAGARV